MSEKRLFPDDPRETLYREAMDLAAALIAQLVMVLQTPEPPGAAALRAMMRGTLAHAEAVARRIVWMLAAVLAARPPQTAAPRPALAPAIPASSRALPNGSAHSGISAASPSPPGRNSSTHPDAAPPAAPLSPRTAPAAPGAGAVINTSRLGNRPRLLL